MDNNSFASIRSAVQELPKVDILVNNAGVNVFNNPSTLTEDGFDVTYQTNYLSQMYLYKLLKPTKVVNVSSSAQKIGTLHFEDHSNAYANTKLASVYMANYLSRRPGVIATSLNPGIVGGTEMGRHAPPDFVAKLLENKTILPLLKSVEQGAATIVLAVVKDFNGKFLEDCSEAVEGEDDGIIWNSGYVPRTYDSKAEEELWQLAEKQLGGDRI